MKSSKLKFIAFAVLPYVPLGLHYLLAPFSVNALLRTPMAFNLLIAGCVWHLIGIALWRNSDHRFVIPLAVVFAGPIVFLSCGGAAVIASLLLISRS